MATGQVWPVATLTYAQHFAETRRVSAKLRRDWNVSSLTRAGRMSGPARSAYMPDPMPWSMEMCSWTTGTIFVATIFRCLSVPFWA